MEGTLGEIRMFSGNFAPRGWAFCDGSLLSIAQDTALYAIIGTIYGGDGRTSFGLPDLRSRIAVGAGAVAGLEPCQLGVAMGEEELTLLSSQMPVHTHTVNTSASGGVVNFSAILNGVNGAGGLDNPTNNLLGTDTVSSTTSYASPGSGTPAPMNSGSVTLELHVPPPNITLGVTGGSMSHNNIQPVLAVNFIICVQGIFPSRN